MSDPHVHPHDHEPHDRGGHAHGADHATTFRRLFWINLLIAVPVVLFSPMFAMLLGYEVPVWARWIPPLLGTVMYASGGRPFLTGAIDELRRRSPGMMMLISLAPHRHHAARPLDRDALPRADDLCAGLPGRAAAGPGRACRRGRDRDRRPGRAAHR